MPLGLDFLGTNRCVSMGVFVVMDFSECLAFPRDGFVVCGMARDGVSSGMENAPLQIFSHMDFQRDEMVPLEWNV